MGLSLKKGLRFAIWSLNVFMFQASERKCPLLYYLSGLTCTEQNVVTKGGTQGPAAKHGIVIVTPDTSPSKICLFLQLVFNSSDGRVVRLRASASGDSNLISSRVKPVTLKLIFTASCWTFSIKGIAWRTSRQVYLLCR